MEKWWINERELHLTQRTSADVSVCIYEKANARIRELGEANGRLQEWVNDLQAGMYINCVYCGHRYGPDTEVPATMADVLKKHIEQCPKHPLFHAKKRIRELEEELADYKEGTEGLKLCVGDLRDERDRLRKALEERQRVLPMGVRRVRRGFPKH